MSDQLEKLANVSYVDYQNYLIRMAINDILIYKNKTLIIPDKFDFINNTFYEYPYSKSGSESYDLNTSLFGKKFFITLKLNKITYHTESLINTNTAFIELYLKIAFDVMKVAHLIELEKQEITTLLNKNFNNNDLDSFLKTISYIELYEKTQENKTIIEAINEVALKRIKKNSK